MWEIFTGALAFWFGLLASIFFAVGCVVSGNWWGATAPVLWVVIWIIGAVIKAKPWRG